MRYAVEENGKLVWIDTSVKPYPKPQTEKEQHDSLMRKLRKIADVMEERENTSKYLEHH